MRLRARRRNLLVWSSQADPVGGYGAFRLPRPARNRRIRRFVRTSVLLTVMGLMNLARGAYPRRQLLLAGVVLTVAGVVLRSQPAGVILLPGLLLVFSAPLIPAVPEDDREQRFRLERELAAYSTPADRRDLEATLDQYPDQDTSELRDILAGQALVAGGSRIPGTGRS